VPGASTLIGTLIEIAPCVPCCPQRSEAPLRRLEQSAMLREESGLRVSAALLRSPK